MFGWLKKSKKQEEGLIKDYNNMVDAVNDFTSELIDVEDLSDTSNYFKALSVIDDFTLHYIEIFVELEKRQKRIDAGQEELMNRLSEIETLLDRMCEK